MLSNLNSGEFYLKHFQSLQMWCCLTCLFNMAIYSTNHILLCIPSTLLRFCIYKHLGRVLVNKLSNKKLYLYLYCILHFSHWPSLRLNKNYDWKKSAQKKYIWNTMVSIANEQHCESNCRYAINEECKPFFQVLGVQQQTTKPKNRQTKKPFVAVEGVVWNLINCL